VRVEAVQALDDHRIGIGSAPSLFPGGKFTHENNTAQSDNKAYVVLRCTHSYVDQTYISGGGAPVAYAGTYEMMDSSRQFRSLLATRRAVVIGWQSALVVADKGNESEEIDVDKKGRILVKFYWDRKKDLSRRVRVAQFWAGKTRGAWFCQRIGDEVLVQYEDGDPDRPIVVGSVYNGENTVPTTLPDNKTHSGILTKSSKSSDGYHMLMFDDTVNNERVKLRSQKDLYFKALNNEQRDILMDQTENIGKDETINVGMGDSDITKGGGNWTLNAFKTATINVGPQGMPLTQILMTQQDITLNVGPEGLFAQIVMNASGITFSVMGGLTTQSWSPAAISSMSPTINETALAAINMTAPMVTAAASLMTPALVAGGAIVGGIPI
jgi:type VI secretion system secreted protein VgrG